MVTRKQAYDAIKILQEYCKEQPHLEDCKHCIIKFECDKGLACPYDWRRIKEREEE